MEIVNTIAETYALQNTSALDPLLQKILDETIIKHPKHHMISGVQQGKLLEWFSVMVQPNYILEIGTFTGFSALCLAKGLQSNGALHTIELRNEDAINAQNYFDQSKHKNQLHLHIGNAIDIIPTLTPVWDLVFIDADKVNYSQYYDLILPKLSSKGIIIVDNVFFHGQVFESTPKGKNAIAIAAFNQKIMQDNSVEKIMLTIRDGLMLIRKK
jgi:caffeoyl-CoA O-methyltransferase